MYGFCKLNALTVPDLFPLLRVEAVINRVEKTKFMIKLDMTKECWQIPTCPESIPLTVFVTPHDHYQWKFMDFGLRNAAATF